LNADTLQQFLLVAPIFIFSIVAHEVAHGYAALRQGDPTAYQLGRLTFNPIKHVDPFLSIIMPAMLFFASHGAFVLGGAKPVPVNPRNYRRYRRGDIIVSLAGVATNLLLAFVCAAIFAALAPLGRAAPALEPSLGILQAMFVYGIVLNLVLMAFNLIPIPPLDGSHVVKYLLPPAWALRYQRSARYGLLVLVALLAFGGGLLNAWLRPVLLLFGAILGLLEPLALPTALHWMRVLLS
jgi:Zn-dependent protease